MEDFDDLLPEEQEERHRELITLLRQAIHQSLTSIANAQEQAIQRVGEKLIQMENKATPSEEKLAGRRYMEELRLQEHEFVERSRRRKQQVIHPINTLVALLVVSMLVGGAIVLFTNLSQSRTAGPVGRPVIAHAEIDGLEMSMSVTPGPYFLSELISADMSITNHTNTTFMLGGVQETTPCGPALSLSQTGGESPHYTIPLHGDFAIFCPHIPYATPFKPGQTITIQQYAPLTSSGHATLTATARWAKTESTNFSIPLDEHELSLPIQVASYIPLDRLIQLHPKGSQVLIDAPSSVHLVYGFIETCDGNSTGSIVWEPISTHVLSTPGNLTGCPTNDMRWQYAVSAAGYAIAAGKYPE